MFTKLFNTDVLPLLGKRHFDAAKCIADFVPARKPIPGKPFFFLTYDGKLEYLPPEPPLPVKKLPEPPPLPVQPRIPSEQWVSKPSGATHWDTVNVCWRKPGFWWHNSLKCWSTGVYDATLLAQSPTRFIPVETL